MVGKIKAYNPDTLKKALELRQSSDLLPFAGGTDLMVKYKTWAGLLPLMEKPVLFLNNIPEIKNITKEGNNVVIGAGVSLTETGSSPVVPEPLKNAVLKIAAPAVRNRATLAGNICNASPAGDSLLPLYGLDASVRLESINGRRELPVAEFITGPGKTVLKSDELLTAVIIPRNGNNFYLYRKVGTRKANALTKVSFLGLAEIKGERITGISLTFGAVGSVVIRSKETEKKLIGIKTDKINIKDICADYSVLIIPIDDQRSTAKYRKQVALNLLNDFLTQLHLPQLHLPQISLPQISLPQIEEKT